MRGNFAALVTTVIGGVLLCQVGFSKEPVGSKQARLLNRSGFVLYQKKEYKAAMVHFRKAMASDPSWAVPPYNLACTLSILYGQKDESVYCEGPGEIFELLEKAIKINKRRKAKIRTDPDLEPIRGKIAYFKLLGVDTSTPKNVMSVLTQITWFGPKPGVYPASPVLDFQDGKRVVIRYFNFDPEKPVWNTGEGTYRVKNGTIELKVVKGPQQGKTFQGKLKSDGTLIFDGLGRFTDDDDACGA